MGRRSALHGSTSEVNFVDIEHVCKGPAGVLPVGVIMCHRGKGKAKGIN